MRIMNWDEYLRDKSVDDMVFDFTKTFLDIMSCNIPNRVVTIEMLLGLHQKLNKQSRRIIGSSVSGSRKANQIYVRTLSYTFDS